MITTIAGNEQKPQFLPGVSLKHRGLNPYGEPTYRVVWGPSVLYLVGGKWADGAVEYRWIPSYAVEGWVLEKWIPAEVFAGKKELWDSTTKDAETGLLELGPYPERGGYEMCFQHFIDPHTNRPVTPTLTLLDSIIDDIEAGQRYTLKEKLDALLAAHQQRAKDRRNHAVDYIRDILPAFGGVAFSGAHGSSNHKADNVRLKYTTKDIRKSTKSGTRAFGKGR